MEKIKIYFLTLNKSSKEEFSSIEFRELPSTLLDEKCLELIIDS